MDLETSESPYSWADVVRYVIYIMLIIVAAVLGLVALQAWRNRQKKNSIVEDQTQSSKAVDLEDEAVLADDLEEDEWLALARKMLANKNRRLALRATYLSLLALLGRNGMISLMRYKSNREYYLELGRRGHSLPGLTVAFGENVRFFEDVWYGNHEASDHLINSFTGNIERIRDIVQA